MTTHGGTPGESPSLSIVEAAFQEIIGCLGPEPPKCGCDGCQVEMRMALDAARRGLAATRLSIVALQGIGPIIKLLEEMDL